MFIIIILHFFTEAMSRNLNLDEQRRCDFITAMTKALKSLKERNRRRKLLEAQSQAFHEVDGERDGEGDINEDEDGADTAVNEDTDDENSVSEENRYDDNDDYEHHHGGANEEEAYEPPTKVSSEY